MNVNKIEILTPDGRVLMVMPIDETSEDLSQKHERKNMFDLLLKSSLRDEIGAVVFYDKSGQAVDKMSKSNIGTKISIHI